MLQEGYLPQAGQASQQATASVNELKRGVERAAESVIGDDAEALKMAQSELDTVTQQLERELSEASGVKPPQNDQNRTAAAGDGQQQQQQRGQSQQPGPATDRRAGSGDRDQ